MVAWVSERCSVQEAGANAESQVELWPTWKGAASQSQHAECVQEGKTLAQLLYAYRGIAKAATALPADADLEAKTRYSETLFTVLAPEIRKITMLCDFYPRLHSQMSAAIAATTRAVGLERDLVFVQLSELMDIVSTLDHIKDSKPCLLNDISLFKRTVHLARGCMDNSTVDKCTDAVMQFQGLFANARCSKGGALLFILTEALSGEARSLAKESLAAFIKWLTRRLRLDDHSTPEQRWALVRVLIQTIVMADLLIGEDNKDGKKNQLCGVFRSSEKKGTVWVTAEVLELLRKNPIVPVFADMKLNVALVLQRCPNYSSAVAEHIYPEPQEIPVLAKNLTEAYEEALDSLACADLVARTCRTVAQQAGAARQVFETVSQALEIMAECKDFLMCFVAAKLASPNSASPDNQGAHPAQAYANALQSNLSSAELACILQCAVLLKGLGASLFRSRAQFEPLLSDALGNYVDKFISVDLPELVEAADGASWRKSERKVRDAADALARAVGASDTFSNTGTEAPEKSTSKWSKARKAVGLRSFLSSATSMPSRGEREVPQAPQNCSRPCDLSAEQLALIHSAVRTMLHEVGADVSAVRSERRKLFFSRSSTSHKGTCGGVTALVEKLREFSDVLALAPLMQDLEHAVGSLQNLGELWFREFYLDITKCAQVPIDMSLPYLLLKETLLEANVKLESSSSLFAALDIYNDAAELAVHSFRQNFMFDEIEAEVSLVFEQLMFLLPVQVYSLAKHRAAANVLARVELELASETSSANGTGPAAAAAAAAATAATTVVKRLSKGSRQSKKGSRAIDMRKFDSIFRLRSLRLIGRSVDFAALVADKLYKTLSEDIEASVSDFRSSGLDSVTQLELHMKVLEATRHELGLMCAGDERLARRLGSFEELWTKLAVNRIELQARSQLFEETIPGSHFNSEKRTLERTVFLPCEDDSSKSFAPSYLLFGNSAAGETLRALRSEESLGVLHEKKVDSLVAVLAPDKAGGNPRMQLVKALTERVCNTLEDCILPVSRGLRERLHGGSGGETAASLSREYQGLLSKLQGVAEPALEEKVVQALGEIGNLVCVIRMLEAAEMRALASESVQSEATRTAYCEVLRAAATLQIRAADMQDLVALVSTFTFLALSSEVVNLGGLAVAVKFLMDVGESQVKYEMGDATKAVLRSSRLMGVSQSWSAKLRGFLSRAERFETTMKRLSYYI